MGQYPQLNYSNELIIESKVVSFVGITCRDMKCTGQVLVKIVVCVLADISKTTAKKQNAIYRDPSTAQAEFKTKKQIQNWFTLRGCISA